MIFKTWLRTWTVIFLLFSTIIIIFNYMVDPYQIFHKHDRGFSINERYQNAGIINSYLNDTNYDAIVIGTSMSQNFNTTHIEKMFDWNGTLKLTAAGSIPSTQKIFIDKALQTNQVKHVLWEIYTTYSPTHFSKTEPSDIMPKWLYSDNIFLIIQRYLFNIDTIKDSKRILTDDWNGVSLNTYTSWMKEFKTKFKTYSNKSAIDKRIKKLKKYQHKKVNYQFTEEFPAFDFVVSKVKDNPTIEFIFFFPPYSTYYYAIQNSTSISENISMRRELVNLLAPYANAKIYAFDTYSFTKNLHNYKDDKHYSERINDLILTLISKKKAMLTTNNISVYEREFIKQIEIYRTSLGVIKMQKN